MIHDHLCPMVTGKPPFRDDVTDDCLFCPLIALVRRDVAAIKEEAYMDAMDAVAAIPVHYKIRGDFKTYGPYNKGKSDFKDLAISAISRRAMTEHLPECPNHFIGLPADYMERDVYMRRCICEKLRACEERVLEKGLWIGWAIGTLWMLIPIIVLAVSND